MMIPSPGSNLHTSPYPPHTPSQRPASQRASFGPPIPLKTLIDHLLNAKKALSSISTLYRADEIVSTVHALLEESVVLSSRSCFVRRGIGQQINLIEKARRGLGEVARDGEVDFETTIRTVSAADDRLKSTMSVLKSTMVAAQLRPSTEASAPRALIDFIDLSSIGNLHTALSLAVEGFTLSRQRFSVTLAEFDRDRKALHNVIKSNPGRPKGQRADDPLPGPLNDLEFHAAEMATLLDSLTQHFDLCANAVRHTPGGQEALKNAVADHRLPDGVTGSGVISSPAESIHADEVSEQDLRDMVGIIHGDAAEVPGVVSDLEIKLAEMETLFVAVHQYVAERRINYQGSVKAVKATDEMGAKLEGYIKAAEVYQREWVVGKEVLSHKVEELETMRHFYEGYLASYDGLILEVVRRRKREEQMKDVLRKAMEQVERIREDDARERAAFGEEVGAFLPNDLWDGLRRDAPVWECVVYGDGAEEGADLGLSTPDLGRDVVEEAEMRELERARRPLN